MSISSLFKGRIRPGYYFGGFVFMHVVVWVLSLIMNASGEGMFGTLIALVGIIVYLPIMIGLMVRRLHDMNKSGWYILLSLVPLMNILFGFWILFSSGDKEANEFGPAPTHKTFFQALLNLEQKV